MNRSQTKIRKIQEANQILESRFLMTEQSTTNESFGIMSLLKYKDNLINLVNTLNSTLKGGGLNAKQEFCGENSGQLKEKLEPIFGMVDDLIITLKTDADKKTGKPHTEGEVIKMLYNTFNSGIVKVMTNISSHFPEKPHLIQEAVLELQNYLRTKYGQDGSLFKHRYRYVGGVSDDTRDFCKKMVLCFTPTVPTPALALMITKINFKTNI
jgi:hypothetical protein